MEKSNVKHRTIKGIKRIVFVVLAAVLMMSVFTGCLDDVATTTQERLVDPSSSIASSAYNAFFVGTGIVHSSPVFGENVASYACNDDDFITCYDYAYKGDTVMEFAYTEYLSIDGYTEEDVAILEGYCQEDVEFYEEYECAQASYTVSDSYITLKVIFRDVDEKDSLKELYELEFIDREDCDYFSMKSAEDLLIEEGYVKK